MAAAPMKRTKLRSATEALAPKADLIWVVSAVRRETISPDFTVSKKPASSRVRWAKTAVRTSAMTRSPRVITR